MGQGQGPPDDSASAISYRGSCPRPWYPRKTEIPAFQYDERLKNFQNGNGNREKYSLIWVINYDSFIFYSFLKSWIDSNGNERYREIDLDLAARTNQEREMLMEQVSIFGTGFEKNLDPEQVTNFWDRFWIPIMIRERLKLYLPSITFETFVETGSYFLEQFLKFLCDMGQVLYYIVSRDRFRNYVVFRDRFKIFRNLGPGFFFWYWDSFETKLCSGTGFQIKSCPGTDSNLLKDMGLVSKMFLTLGQIDKSSEQLLKIIENLGQILDCFWIWGSF